MAVRRRTIKTVTEDFDDLRDTPLQTSTQTMGTTSTALQDVKANRTQMQADDDEDLPTPPESLLPASGDHNRFSNDLKAWIGHHSLVIFIAALTAVGTIVTTVWVAAEKQARTTTLLETFERNVRDLTTDLRAISERLVRVEVRTVDPPPTSGNQKLAPK